jgi:fructokinase
MSKLFGGIEAGGTKFLYMVGTSPDQIVAEERFPTTTPQETLGHAVEFFQPYTRQGLLGAIGIGAFGPLDLNPSSSTYGFITTTPKSGWRQVDLRGELQRALGVPVALDTDVNSAAYGEYYWNKDGSTSDPLLYVTVGTGIGLGVIVAGQPLHGLIHPEGGHLFVPHSRADDPFDGVCPYHGDCLEGLASGPAMERRWGVCAESLPAGHPGWDLEARYLALGLCNLIYAFSPQRIVLGGGVLQHPGLIEKIRLQVSRLINGYVQSTALVDHIDRYVTRPVLGTRSGILGALALAISLKE